MKFVAVCNSQTGEITSLCALPEDANAPTVGMQLKPGEVRVEFEAPEEFALKPGDLQLHTQMEKMIKEYRIESTNKVKLVEKAAAKRE